MKTTASDVISELTLAEAAAWLTRLQEGERLPATEAAFREWLSASPAHARAFMRVTDVWELIPGTVKPAPGPKATPRRSPPTRRSPWVFVPVGAALALVLVALDVMHTQPPPDYMYQTAVGEQKTVVLADNTRITLNTDTRLTVQYRKGERHVQLEHGEAEFAVTKNLHRPFVVQTGDEQIRDLGTVFDVSNYSKSVVVTLVEGAVWVGNQKASGSSAAPTVLAPGQRLTIDADGRRVLDKPDVQQTTAWQRGQIYFDNTSLADAVVQLQRYGGVRIRIDDPSIATLRVSGVFSWRDPVQFASAVASLHNLRAVHKDGGVVLLR